MTSGDKSRDLEPCIAVVGMHRSGTSATAGLLIGLGLAGPRRTTWWRVTAPMNGGTGRATRCNSATRDFSRRSGATTYAPPPFTEDWSDVADYESVKARANHWFAATYAGRAHRDERSRASASPCPSGVTTVPAPMAAIFVLRDPMHVARSLQARDGIPILLGSGPLGPVHTVRQSKVWRGSPPLWSEYDSMIEDRAEPTGR